MEKEKIEIVPPVDKSGLIEFDCRDKKDRVVSQLKIVNNKDVNVVSSLCNPRHSNFGRPINLCSWSSLASVWCFLGEKR